MPPMSRIGPVITSRGSWCLLKVYQVILEKLKIGNTRSAVNQWDLPDEFILNGESLINKTKIIVKFENMKTVKLDRQEDLSEISQLSTQTWLIIYSQPAPHLSLVVSSAPTSHATASQLISEIPGNPWNSLRTNVLEVQCSQMCNININFKILLNINKKLFLQIVM